MTVVSVKIVEEHGNGCSSLSLRLHWLWAAPRYGRACDVTVVSDTIALVSFEEQLVAGATELLSFPFSFPSLLLLSLCVLQGSYAVGFELSNLHVLCSNLSVDSLMV